jgi:5'-3' exonuclease
MIKKYNFVNIESKEQLLMDFFILFFLLGNDYVASSPSIYHFDVLFQFIFPIYKEFQRPLSNKKGLLERKNICDFFKIIGISEKKWLEKKYENQNSYFPDLIFLQTSQNEFDFEKYKKDYNELYFRNNILKAQKDYLDNIDNILKMYSDQDFNWEIFYPYYKAPFLSDFRDDKLLLLNSTNTSCNNIAKDMYFHLLTVLPPQSKQLLPIGLQTIFYDLKYFFPSHIEIDLTGKQKLWEGIVKLPLIDTNCFLNFYLKHKDKISEPDKKRNTIGKTFIYTYDLVHAQNFESYYGIIQNSPVFCKLITI